MSIIKKWNKLRKNPKLFFTDMYEKRQNYILKHSPSIKYKTEQKFTVVSAVYGVERYLNDYFESLVNQTIGFEDHIHLILVDDDSKDNSAQIIKKWQKKYPNNITYIHKENGGQASARNFGMDYVKTKWVSFMDPDDFVSLDYYEEIAKVMDKNPEDTGMVCCNFIFYNENVDQYSDTHPLKYRFANGIKYNSNFDFGKNIVMAVNSGIFLTQVILENDLFFDTRLKPSFEDARFASEYIYYIKSLKVAFLPSAKYYYRKREDNSSTLDTSWNDKRKFLDAIERGPIFVLEFYKERLEQIPEFIQRQALYDFAWICKRLINNPNPLNILSEDEKIKFYENAETVLSYIDKEVILGFDLAGIWFLFKVGILGTFKGITEINQIAYIERYDPAKKEILISYHSYNDSDIAILFDNNDTIPKYQKKKKHTFGDKYFVTTYKLWVPLPENFNKFEIKFNGVHSKIFIKGTFFYTGVSHEKMMEHLAKFAQTNKREHWILMDRDSAADDNAEHLYRYIRSEHPNRDIYYVLSNKSHDWDRLKKDNFNLLNFGSFEHKKLLKTASKVVSSHIDKYVNDYFSDGSMLNQQFVFLQHGVIKDDLSNWINTKKNVSLMLTSTEPEFNSIAFDDKYFLTNKEVKLTGLPRHDALFFQKDKFASEQKIILIMPTWRDSILPKAKTDRSERDKNPNFMLTDYAIHWKSFIHSEELKRITNDGVKVIFALHKNIEPYLDEFNIPSYIEQWRSENCSIQELFLKSTLLITDYSSIAFEMAYLEKQIIYYQFDENEFFSGKHTFSKGYFDYRQHGFGPVVTKEEDLNRALNDIVKNDFAIKEPYFSRIKTVYPYRDGKCCERTFEAIEDLDKPYDMPEEVNVSILTDFLLRAYQEQNWPIAIQRAIQLLSIDKTQEELAYLILAEATYYLRNPSLFPVNISNIKNHKVLAFLFMGREQWYQAYDSWNKVNENSSVKLFYQLICCQHLPNKDHIVKVQNEFLLHSDYDKEMSLLINSLISAYNKDWNTAIDQLNILLKSNVNEYFLKKFFPELILADVYRKNNEPEKCQTQLVNFEKHKTYNFEFELQKIKLYIIKKDYSGISSHLKKTFNNNYMIIPVSALNIYIEALQMSANWEEIIAFSQVLLKKEGNWKIIAQQMLAEAGYRKYQISLFFNNVKVRFEDIKDNKTKAFILMTQEKWEGAFQCWEKITNKKAIDLFYQLTCCYYLHSSTYAMKIKSAFLEKGLFEQNELDILNVLVKMTQQNWGGAIMQLNPLINSNTNKYFLKKYILQLILADIFRNIGQYEKSNKLLDDFEKHTPNNTQCHIQMVKVALAQKNYKKVVNLLNEIFGNNYQLMPPSVLADYIQGLTMFVSNEMANLDKIVKFSKKK
ncbi:MULTISPECIES: bifunctional glycosyltransferase/CDP-glycerol:glycerophosphate glycerophosphotransferase [unclassified Gilliamella]|uniref:bifunctional glycosyltransferase/CDP-glycerol:glycerophosphate glycerophosphotransferase n=1 Tax=unclassified Gilliamella TaxID=2685620 RepID=UPI00226A69DF|nr:MULTISPECIES: CDP-glycerol glycerophosphotransferase family protein [unclassified Gilliamella]MCX8665618.1 CDP-glycerol glycerophosphotransferase family protein [Gilliamella sp. B2887]MCX8698624.1 CDP-glycerol glycerophosphotransferase family protein [Gilliamella sp. B3000]